MSSYVSLVNSLPRATCRVRLAPNLYAEQPAMPSPWHRFWQRLLLGWTWERIQRDASRE